MMNEIIKRVSEAILTCPNSSDYPELVARRAIEAMRDPTEEMNDACYEAMPVAFKCVLFIPAYQAMIDAALKGDA